MIPLSIFFSGPTPRQAPCLTVAVIYVYGNKAGCHRAKSGELECYLSQLGCIRKFLRNQLTETHTVALAFLFSAIVYGVWFPGFTPFPWRLEEGVSSF